MKRILSLSIFIAIAVLAALGQERYVRPRDEAVQDKTFVAFRNKLIAAAEKRDLRYVKSVMDPKIKLSFGGHEGVKDFEALWPDKVRFWKEFLAVIKNGGVWFREGGRSKGLFTAPYSFDGFPSDLDAFEHFVIFGSDVNLRKSPVTGGEIVGRLSYNIVKIVDAAVDRKERPAWHKVRTLGGQTGYVSANYVRSPIDYRAGFEKKKGRWVMTFFLAGD